MLLRLGCYAQMAWDVPPVLLKAATQICFSVKVLFTLPIKLEPKMITRLLWPTAQDRPVPEYSAFCRRRKPFQPTFLK